MHRILPCLVLLAVAGGAGAAAIHANDAAFARPHQLVDIGGRRLNLYCSGSGPVTVVFDSPATDAGWNWHTVQPGVAARTRACVYDRAGVGFSDPSPAASTSGNLVADLHALLGKAGIDPPYVMVGSSFGAMNVQLYAYRYPDEVKGLVLVDALYPRMVKRTADFPLYSRLAGRLAFSRTVWREIEGIDETGEQILALDGIDDKPIVRLVNQPQSATAIAVDFGAFRMDEETRRQVSALYPKAKKVVVDSSHQMALTSPEVVAAAVREVMAAAD